MRQDMHKVVTESARGGHSNPSRKWAKKYNVKNVDMEADGPLNPQRAPIARYRQYGSEAKDFSDNIGPLRRYLRAQVGRPWDDVNSELRAVLPDGLHMNHIMEHVGWEVAKNCFEATDGTIRVRGNYSRYGGRVHNELYVHPRTGILTYAPKDPDGPRRKPVVEEIGIDADSKYHMIDGIWYYERFGDEEYTFRDYANVLVRKTRRVQIAKEQLDHKTLKKLGVVNCPGKKNTLL